jgi:hypothetical protein
MVGIWLYSVFITGPAMHGAAQQQLAQTKGRGICQNARLAMEVVEGLGELKPRRPTTSIAAGIGPLSDLVL